MGLLECLSGPAKIELTSIGDLGKLGCPLLGLVKVVVSSLDSIVAVRVLALLKAVQTSELVDVLLVTVTLLLELAQLKVGVVNFLLESVAGIGLLGDISLGGENLSLASVNLLPSRSDLTLQVVVVAVLFVEEETSVINLLAQHMERGCIGVVALLEVIVLEELLVLEMAVLGLDGVELIPEREVVFVALLDFEDLSLELTNEQILLVAGEVHAVVVLQMGEPRRLRLTLDIFDC